MLCSSCHAQRNHIDIYIDINIDIYIDIYKLTERPVVLVNAIFLIESMKNWFLNQWIINLKL